MPRNRRVPTDRVAGFIESRLTATPGDHNWVGCIVFPRVTIGRGVRVAAETVMTGDLPDNAVAMGAPAPFRRTRP